MFFESKRKIVTRELASCAYYNPDWWDRISGIDFYSRDGKNLTAQKGNVILKKIELDYKENFEEQIYQFVYQVWELAVDEGIRHIPRGGKRKYPIIEWTNYQDYYNVFSLMGLVDESYMESLRSKLVYDEHR